MMLAAFFLLGADLLQHTGLVRFTDETRVSFYFLVVIAGTLISSRGFRF